MNLQQIIKKFATPEKPAHLKDRLSDLKKMSHYRPDNIPFVVLAMNHKEAQELFDGEEAIFHYRHNVKVAEEQTRRFHEFKQVFHQIFQLTRATHGANSIRALAKSGLQTHVNVLSWPKSN